MEDFDPNVKKFHELVKEGLDFESVSQMIEDGIVNIDCTDQFGNTPLMLGSLFGRSTMSCMLLELGAQINARNALGASALNHSLSNRQIDTTLLLLRRGANPNNRAKNGNIPLLFTIQLGLTDLCRELLRYGADLDVQLDDGANAAFLASQNGNLDLLKLLAASGADLGMVRKDQTTALLIACQIGHTDIVAELLNCYKKQRIVFQKKRMNAAEKKATKHVDIIRRCAKKAAIKGFEDIVKLLTEHAELFDDNL